MGLKKVFIKRTIGEWNAIDKKMSDLGKSNVSSYLRTEIPRIKIIMEECPECITPAQGIRKQRTLTITEDSYKAMKRISDLMGKPLASVIDELLITPLLLEK